MDSTLSKIMLYFNDYLFPPKYGWASLYTIERAYERWTAGYIIDKIIANNDLSGIKVVEDIILYFNEAAGETESKEQRYLFTVAAETANNILDTIRKEN